MVNDCSIVICSYDVTIARLIDFKLFLRLMCDDDERLMLSARLISRETHIRHDQNDRLVVQWGMLPIR